MLDVAAFNAFILTKKEGYNRPKKKFMKDLARMLVSQSAIKRHKNNNQRIPKRSREAAEILGFIPDRLQYNQPKNTTILLGRCKICSKVTM